MTGLNFKCALDSKKAFEASHCIKQEWKTNIVIALAKIYMVGLLARGDDYMPEGCDRRMFSRENGWLMEDYII